MKRAILYLCIIITIFVWACKKSPKSDSQMVIMAYYVAPQENYTPQTLPLDKITHIIFSFTEVIDNKMQFKYKSSIEKLTLLVQQKAIYPDLKVMIACGGWGGSKGFSDMASTQKTRDEFVESVIDFLQTYNLDGLDMDWEYPGLAGAGNTFRMEDKENFTLLMKQLREAMDATSNKYILTFASAGWKKYYDHIELGKVMHYADYMNIMTYDLAGGDTPFCAHHTNLGNINHEQFTGSPAAVLMNQQNINIELRSTKQIVSYCLDKGVDPAKVVIGAAFYGKGWRGVPGDNNGLYQLNKGEWKKPMPYKDIQSMYENKAGFNRYWDPGAQAPYLYNSTDSIFITYDDPQSVRLKVKYAREKGLAGIMFWQLNLDVQHNGLLHAIYSESTK